MSTKGIEDLQYITNKVDKAITGKVDMEDFDEEIRHLTQCIATVAGSMP
mgnify:CR=1 FL=1|jgi:hypothetical protein